MLINKVLVTGRMYQELGKRIEQLSDLEVTALPEQEITKEILNSVDGLVAFQPPPEFQLGNIKWIHSLGAGVDKFVQAIGDKEQVILTRTIGSFGRMISQYCLQYILHELQQAKFFENAQNRKEWSPLPPIQLEEITIVVLGTGEIGKVIAEDFSYLGAEVYGISKSGSNKEGFKEVYPWEECSIPLKKAHWVINTLPLTKDTENLLGDEFFDCVTQCGLINVGRGATVEEESLKRALEKGKLSKVILDVFAKEPLTEESWMWNHPNIIITPHIAAITSVEDAYSSFLTTYESIKCGKTIQNIVDFGQGY